MPSELKPTITSELSNNRTSLGLTEDMSDADSVGGDIPARPIEGTKADEEQVNGELQDKFEESGAKEEDEEASEEEEEEGV
jgi:hypothetical protein